MRLTASLLLLLPTLVFGQNLVVNGGFERFNTLKNARLSACKPCSYAFSAAVFNDNAAGWKTFDVTTPDLLVLDSSAACPDMPRPHGGKRMVGLIMYHPFQDGQFAFDYHEFIQGSLSKPLIPGKTYRLRFWVRSDDSLGIRHLNQVYGRSAHVKPVRSGNFGFWFSKSVINQHENLMQSQVDFPVTPQVVLETIVETNGRWQRIDLDFKADQPYRYFLFGNFSFDAVTPINMNAEDRMKFDEQNTRPGLAFPNKIKRIGYYCFDDFSIEEMNDAWLERNLAEGYALPAALLFDSGKWDLKPAAKPELLRFAAVLNKKQGQVLEIGGHTDQVGDERANQTLSERRARAVYDFLLQQGVPAAALTTQGYGETRPVADNETEMGRQLNRRVVFRFAGGPEN